MSHDFPTLPEPHEPRIAERYDGIAQLKELYQFGEAALEQASVDMPWVEVVGGEPTEGNHFAYRYVISRDYDRQNKPTGGLRICRRDPNDRYRSQRMDTLTVMSDGTATASWWVSEGPYSVQKVEEVHGPAVANVWPHELKGGRILTLDKYMIVDRPGKETGYGRELFPVKKVYKRRSVRAIGRRLVDRAVNAFGLDD